MRHKTWMLVLGLISFPAFAADVPPECVNVYQRGDAYPGDPDCRWRAASAPFGLGNYHCSSPTIIAAYCGSTPFDPGKNNECELPTGPTQTGNPVNMFVGNKTETVADYTDPGGRLSFTRHYSSLPLPANPGTTLGNRWRHDFQISLVSGTLDGQAVLRLNRPSGNSYIYREVSTDVWQSDPDVRHRLVALTLNGQPAGWRVTAPDERQEDFDVSGRLTQIAYPDGEVIELDYDASSQLTQVRDRQGRALTFVYADDLISAIGLPDGRWLGYSYETARLAAVAYQISDGASPQFSAVRYLYGDPNDTGLLTGVIDENDQRYATWSYDDEGRAISSQHGDPLLSIDKVSIVYGGGESYVTTPLGKTVTYGYEAAFGRAKLASSDESCASCGTSQVSARTYDANGYPDLYTDFEGIVTDHDYDARGRLIRRVEAQGTAQQRTVETDWLAESQFPAERRLYNASGVLQTREAWTYNTRGQALTHVRTAPDTGIARTTSVTYCEQSDIGAGTCPLPGLVTAVDGPRTDVNDITTYTYRAADHPDCAATPTACAYRKGDLWKVTNALGQTVETLRYDGAGRVLSVKDANGVVTDLEYNSRGWLVARKVRGTNNSIETDDAITRIAYEPTGRVKQMTLPDGAFTRYHYDTAHRLTRVEDGYGNTINYTLDNAGNRFEERTRDNEGILRRSLTRLYNDLGQLQTLADAYDNPTDYTYDANGDVETITDAYGRVTDHDYDPLGRLKRTLQDVGGIAAETGFEYDALGNLARVTDPKGLDTAYTYNGLGDLTGLDSPDTDAEPHTYDDAGNRKTQTDARGVTVTYGYDALDRMTTVRYPDSSLDLDFYYDTPIISCPASEQFHEGRLGKVRTVSGSVILRYCYDRFGHLTRRLQNSGGRFFTTQYAYTRSGLLSRITYPGGMAADYVRDAQGRVTEIGITRPGAAREVLLHQATYAPFGPVSGWTYGNGQPMRRTLNQNYHPDIIQGAGASFGYEFDAVGNFYKKRGANQSDPPRQVFVHDALNRLTEVQDGTGAVRESYSYDATGNRTTATDNGITQTYSYPADSHRLMAIGSANRSYDAAGNTVAINGTEREFVYNDAGRMSQAKRNGVVVMNYEYNGKGEQVHRYLGATSVHTIYDEAGHWLAEYDSTGAPLQQVIWLDDLPVGVVADNKLLYVAADALGTPRTVYDPQRGKELWRWVLGSEMFGADAPLEDRDGDGIPFVFNLRFPGQRYDAASGLNYNYFRDYEPGSGRYVESDPIGLDGGTSTYAYAGGNPLAYFDPKGLASCYYSISDGRLVCYADTPDQQNVNIRVASGNNGGGRKCKDTPACSNSPNRGPIPTGKWRWDSNGWTGKPNGRVLVPEPGTIDHGRDLFRSHSCLNPFGPSLGPTFCSEGCVTGTAKDMKTLNKLLDAEPDSTLTVMDNFFPKMPPRFW